MSDLSPFGIVECVEVEEQLLAALMVGPDQYPLTQAERLLPGMFWLVKHRWIFEAMTELYRRGDDISVVTLAEELEHQGRLAEVNSTSQYLADLAYRYNYTSLGAIRTLAAEIRRDAERRQMLKVLADAAMAVQDKSQSVITAWSKTSRAVNEARPFEPNQNFTYGADTFEVYRQIQEDIRDNPTSYPLPWKALTQIYGEAQPGELFGIIGPTGSGKSAALSTVAEFYAGSVGLRTGYIFTEMRLKKVLDRRMAKNSHLDYRRLKNPVEWTSGEKKMLIDAEARIMAWAHKLDYWHAPSPRASTLLANLRRMNAELGTVMFVIDHLNDIDVLEYDAGPRNWEMLLIDLEVFCNETGSNVWTAAQTNRRDSGNSTYMIGQAFDNKMSLAMELQPKELKHPFVFPFEDEHGEKEYAYPAGKNSPLVPIYYRKNREAGPSRGELLFVGPRYLWVDVPAGFDDGSDDPGAYDDVFRGTAD